MPIKLKFHNTINHDGMGIATILPALLAILLLLLLPAMYTIWLSLNNAGFTLRGYKYVLADPTFFHSLIGSVFYTTSTVILQTFLGTLAALMVSWFRRGVFFISSIFFLPYAVPSVVAVIAWKFLIQDKGALALIVHRIFGSNAQALMSELILLSLIIVSIWQFYPFVFITILARLRRIPPALYLTAEIDGANKWHQFTYVTLPQIRSTLLAVIVLRVAFMFTKFDTPWLLGGQTANQGTRLLPIYIYEKMVGIAGPSIAGVAAAVLMACCLALVMLLMRRSIKGTLL